MRVVTDIIEFAIVVDFVVCQARPRPPSRFRSHILPVVTQVAAYQNFRWRTQIEYAIASLRLFILFGIRQVRVTVLYQHDGIWQLAI
ncbi:MAG: hypothetical protein C7B45_12960 [Sulfobacillus acidophilus]|uniref:Uncharacterized protein n=1 Tax=Sulfobacillus acidophilus TaxID=53633 RepID=A0A2T2WF78_9FIRM|nr:MAG: hypothetical protein C7B45_12960 [Sulfobacillus acidophilus]